MQPPKREMTVLPNMTSQDAVSAMLMTNMIKM